MLWCSAYELICTCILLCYCCTGGFTDSDDKLMADKIAFQSRIPTHVNVVKFLGQLDDTNETGMKFT